MRQGVSAPKAGELHRTIGIVSVHWCCPRIVSFPLFSFPSYLCLARHLFPTDQMIPSAKHYSHTALRLLTVDHPPPRSALLTRTGPDVKASLGAWKTNAAASCAGLVCHGTECLFAFRMQTHGMNGTDQKEVGFSLLTPPAPRCVSQRHPARPFRLLPHTALCPSSHLSLAWSNVPDGGFVRWINPSRWFAHNGGA